MWYTMTYSMELYHTEHLLSYIRLLAHPPVGTQRKEIPKIIDKDIVEGGRVLGHPTSESGGAKPTTSKG